MASSSSSNISERAVWHQEKQLKEKVLQHIHHLTKNRDHATFIVYRDIMMQQKEEKNWTGLDSTVQRDYRLYISLYLLPLHLCVCLIKYESERYE